MKHATASGQQLLIDALATAKPDQAVAILHVLGAVGSEAGNAAIEKALSHAEPQVRGAAAAALFESKRADALPKVFALMADAAGLEELAGCEQALHAAIQDPSLKQQVRDALLAMAGDCQPPARDSVYWLIGQVGDAKSLAALRAAAESENEATFRAAVTALSYCPYPQADAVVLDIIRNSKKKRRASFTAKQCVRRMVVSPDIPGQRPVKEQLDYAEAVLDQVLDSTTIAYLGRIRTGRCAFILQRAMRRGATKSAPQAIIHATSDLTDAPEADRKLAVSALIDTIEFIEVTYLRGGATEQMRDNLMKYAKWKEISVQAGKNLLKLDQTDKAPLPEFDDFDLDM